MKTAEKTYKESSQADQVSPAAAGGASGSFLERARYLGSPRPQGATPPGGRVSPRPMSAGPTATEGGDTSSRPPLQRYLIGHSRQPQVAPLSLTTMFPERTDAVDVFESRIEGITVLRKLQASPAVQSLGLLSAVPQESQEIVVAEMDEEIAESLQARPELVIEPSLPLRLPQTPLPEPPARHPSLLWPQATGFTASIQVLGPDNQPVPEAEVFVFGFRQTGGLTDNQGRATISLFGESVNSITGLYIKPKVAYWDRWVRQPSLDPGTDFQVRLRPLEEQFPGFPGQEALGWGYTSMKIDQLDPAKFHGQGIKVAIVDSGADAAHPDLRGQVEIGASLVGDGDWAQDTIAHGSHCAGVIAGLRGNGGVRGIAPRARLFIYKIFPGGAFDHLIDALDRCIEAGVDVVNLSLGADAGSVFVEERLRAARNAGVACIVAAGNSSGPVQYPASSDQVLSVAAIGKAGQFPADSYHGQQVLGTPDANGYFSAKFTCFGSRIDVCAPGVAVLSSVPSSGYAAWDGTSMASPHVTGLAALILAHHPDFRSPPFSERNAQRVDRLFQILRTTAQRLNLDRQRTGAGLPDAVRALNLAADGDSNGSSGTGTVPTGGSSFLERIRALEF